MSTGQADRQKREARQLRELEAEVCALRTVSTYRSIVYDILYGERYIADKLTEYADGPWSPPSSGGPGRWRLFRRGCDWRVALRDGVWDLFRLTWA